MTNISNLEIIQLQTVNGKLIALLSYRDANVEDLSCGYSTIYIPVNIRELQYSVYGNLLVNQSLQNPPEYATKD